MLEKRINRYWVAHKHGPHNYSAIRITDGECRFYFTTEAFCHDFGNVDWSTAKDVN